ncbi:MAG: hypothetical protein ACE5IP_10435 [Terriglobia bacterium]
MLNPQTKFETRTARIGAPSGCSSASFEPACTGRFRFSIFVLLFLVAGHWSLVAATSVSGTINRPDGTPVNGTLEFILSQSATTTTPPVIYAPAKTTCPVTNGLIAAGCTVQGNDTLNPAGTFYRVRVLDANNRVVVPSTNYTIIGAAVDLGTLPVTATDTLVPPDGNVTGDLTVTGNLTVGGTFNLTGDPQEFNHIRLLGQAADPTTQTAGSVFYRSDLDRVRFRSGGLEVFDGTQYLPVTAPASQTLEIGANIRLPGLFAAVFKRLNEIRLVDPNLWTETTVPAKIDAAINDCAGAQCLLVLPSNLAAGEPTLFPDNVVSLDLRRSGGHRYTGTLDTGVRKGIEIRAVTSETAASELWQPLQVHLTAATGGINNSGGPKIQYNGLLASLANKTRGQATAGQFEIGCFAQGDCTGLQARVSDFGGSNAGGDEGAVGLRILVTQGESNMAASTLFTATVSSDSFDAVNNETTVNYTAPANENRRGENRHLVNLTTAVTTPGTISGISGTPPLVTGSGTTFATSLGVTTPYTPAEPDVCFSMVADDHAASGDKLIVPVRTVTSDTSLTLDYRVAGADKAWVGAASGGYRLYRCKSVKRLNQAGSLVLSGDQTSLFAANDAIEQPLGFDFQLPAGIRIQLGRRLPSATVGQAGIDIQNLEPANEIRSALQIQGTGWTQGIRFTDGGPSQAALQFDQPNSAAEGRLRWALASGNFDLQVSRASSRLDLVQTTDTANQFNFFGSGLAIGTTWQARTSFLLNSNTGFLKLGVGTNPTIGFIRQSSGTAGTPLLVARNQANTTDVNLITYSTADTMQLAEAGTRVEFVGGVHSNGSGLKHGRVTTGAIAAGSSAAVTATWTTAFADANYTVNCTVVEATAGAGSLRLHHLESVTAAAVVARVVNDDTVNPLTGTLHCIAMHD